MVNIFLNRFLEEDVCKHTIHEENVKEANWPHNMADINYMCYGIILNLRI